MFLAVLSLCVASCLAEPSIGYSYSAYAPLSHSYVPYSPHYAVQATKSIYPVGYPFVYSQPYSLISAHTPVALKTQYHTSDVYGQSVYGHSEPHQSHHAVHDAHGNKVGSFSYVKPDGQVHRTDYVADANGYRAASNDLPIAPAAAGPLVPVLAHHDVVDVPVVPQETPEVLAAKQAHFAAHAKALVEAHALRRKRSIYSYASVAVSPNGYVADTPEVAAAKAAHFAEHAKRGNYYVASPYAASHSYAAVGGHRPYYVPYASAPLVTSDGYLVDTPEVAAAKAAHFAEHAKAAGHYGAALPLPAAYGSAVPVVGADGHVLDTPEVAAAKSAHLSEHAAAAHHHAALVAPHHSAAVYASHSPSYYAANNVVLPNGYLADTPDVAHAKAAHFAEYAKVASRQKRSVLALTPAHTVPLVAAAHLPLASSVAYAYPTYPHAVSALHPFLRQATHTTVVHGPHAVSYTHQA